jgi:LmbE family N-acetylglucosaminyl deacetylase
MKQNRKVRKNVVLVVAAHPDDEVLGSGGTLIKHVKCGDEVFCLILGEGIMSRLGAEKKEIDKLRSASQKAGRIIGFRKSYFADFPDNSFDTISLLKITQKVEKYFRQIKPNIVYTHHGNDLNIDHQLTFQAVLTASRPCNIDYPKEIYAFETPSSTEWQVKNGSMFSPNVYINIEDTINKKVTAFEEYKSEIRSYPHPRSRQGLKILAQYRGLEVGLKYAEAFCLIRKITK